MTNVEASEVLEQWIAKNSPCNGLEQALLRAVTALQHQPEPQRGCIGYQCESCGVLTISDQRALCSTCGSHDLRPVYTTEAK